MNTTPDAEITSIAISCRLPLVAVDGYAMTTTGLKKAINEDRIGHIIIKDRLRVCLCDGHWGEGAAEMVRNVFLNPENSFPINRDESVSFLKRVEKGIFEAFGNTSLTGLNGDRTTETSLIVFEISDNRLRLISYGDCRFFLLAKDSIFSSPLIQSWLGSFSYLGLRNRLKLEESLFYTELPISSGDSVLFFSDGVDECIYEKSTIPISEICQKSRSNRSCEYVVKSLLAEVFRYGAEDNASIGLIRIV